MKRWNMIYKVKALYDEGKGLSIKAIGEQLKMSRNTVRKYLNMSEDEIYQYLNNPERTKVLDKYLGYITHLLQKYPKLSGIKIARKLQENGLEAAISKRTVQRYIRNIKSKMTLPQQRYYEPVIDMVPGVQCQVDPGELRNLEVGKDLVTIYFCVFVLSYSRYSYVAFSHCPINTRIFIRMHDEAFTFFGGVCQECVYDQTKLVAIQEEFREVWLNQEFEQYANKACFDVRVCEGYDPESKGKVEAGVKYAKNSFFYGEQFSSFKELKERLLDWIQNVSNVRVHGSTQKVPYDVYDVEERHKMRPYLSPCQKEIPLDGKRRSVDKTSLISYQSTKYSVPSRYQSSSVIVQREGERILIYDPESHEKIAEHAYCRQKGMIKKLRSHYRDKEEWIQIQEGLLTDKLGEDIGNKICHLLEKTAPKIYKDQLVGLLKVLNSYPNLEPFQSALLNLSVRETLKVTFIREYLLAIYQKHQKTSQTSFLPPVKTKLERYSSLSSTYVGGK